MYTCSITGMPFQHNPNAVVIPVLISQSITDSNISNTNIRPFPISVRGSFQEELFYIDKADSIREKFMMDMISKVIGKTITWEEFQQLRGNEKEVEHDDKSYIIGFFACHQNIYNSIVDDFTTHGSLSKKKINFNQYCQEFTSYISGETSHLSHLINEPYRTKLGSNRTGFIVPDNFDEVHLPCLAEVRFINAFLSSMGKKWEVVGICSYNSNSAFNIYKNSILELQ